MSTQYLSVIRQKMETVLNKIAPLVACDAENTVSQMVLRPPKNPGWGDLCTNILLMVCSDDEEMREKIAVEFIDELEQIDFVHAVKLSKSGYLNLHIKPDYWGGQLLDICQEGIKYGFKDDLVSMEPFIAMMPTNTDDLVSLRQQWTVEALSKLAKAIGCGISLQNWTPPEQRGFSSKAAISKCSEKILKLSIVSNSADFAVKFSPFLAADRSYDNPAFSFPYALARIDALLSEHASDTIGEDGVILPEPIDAVNFTKEIEVELAKHLCHWPVYLRKALVQGDMSYLTSFLQETTLLFFRLYQQEKIQSSDYLSEKGYKNARKLLLKSVSAQIGGCLKLMGIDRAEEFI